MLSDVCLTTFVAYIGPKSRRERPRKTKICTEVAHVTRDSDTRCFFVKLLKIQCFHTSSDFWPCNHCTCAETAVLSASIENSYATFGFSTIDFSRQRHISTRNDNLELILSFNRWKIQNKYFLFIRPDNRVKYVT